MKRFWDKVEKTDSCWIWTACKNPGGYGIFALNGKSVLAHRQSVILDGRDPIDLCVCHSCDNPSCVRPDHLFLGTDKDNVADRNKKNRQGKGYNQLKLRKLTIDDVRDIRASSLSQRQLASKYNVAKTTIGKILNDEHYYRDKA